MKSGRIAYLEFARGIASIIVVFHHFTLSFWPGLKLPLGEGGLLRSPLYALINGFGAVAFFFVLSGFVLTYGFYRAPSGPTLLASVLKRLPRLALPAGLSIFAGLAILLYSGAPYRTAAALTGSPWLRDFGNVVFPPGFQASAADALRTVVTVFLIPYNHYYNSNLWTMFVEFYGSLAVFIISFFYLLSRSYHRLVMIVVHLILFWMAINSVPQLANFVVGSALAYWFARRDRPLRLPLFVTIGLLLVAVFGYSLEDGLACLLASFCVMLVLLGNPSLAERLSGRLALLIGRLSFPLYLVHTLVILSLSSLAYVALAGFGPVTAAIGAFWVTAIGALAFAVPLMLIDGYWVAALNRVFKRLCRVR